MVVRSQDLRTGYAGVPVHEPVDIELAPGSKALLDGRSGSGRSALLETLAGTRQPLDGVVRWDGHSRPKIDDAKERIVLVRDEVVAGTVFNNLRMGNAALSTVLAWQALESVGLARVVDALPDGLDCELLPSGAPLSPGQVRRLALARALVARPSLVLIDETLDYLSEDDVEQRRLSELFLAADSPCTTIVASRDPRVRELLGNTIKLTESPR
jgi:ABC-type transport system involved in cytochrome bd biosynthesis fused ATPase/permease subunit